MINRLHAVIKLNMLYTCNKCKKVEVGSSTVRKEFTVTSSEELKQCIDNIHKSSNDMPIGWSYNDNFTCGNCTKR